MINVSDFIHPEDEAALEQMKSIPGFPLLVKKFLGIGFEQLQYGINMASYIRLSKTQLPELFNRLPPICQKLGIPVPEFYLSMNPLPNAWTFGDSRISITMTSGLVDLMSERELDSVLSHECGHILCHHVLYHSVAQYLLAGLNSMNLLNEMSLPIQYALLYWMRKSELSCDRVSSFITDPETVMSSMARLAGGSVSITKKINMDEWANQANEYESIRNGNLWNKALQVYAISSLSHPFAAVRVREIQKWIHSDQYKLLRETVNNQSNNTCPACGKPVGADWKFCRFCGGKL